MKPASSSGSPVDFSQSGGRACVVQRISSAAIGDRALSHATAPARPARHSCPWRCRCRDRHKWPRTGGGTPRESQAGWSRCRRPGRKTALPDRAPSALASRRSRASSDNSSSTPASSGADQGNAALSIRGDPLAQRIEMAEKAVDRLYRNGMLCSARHHIGIRRRAGVDRQDVVGNRRAVVADHLPCGEIYANRRSFDKAAPRQSAPAARYRYAPRRNCNGRQRSPAASPNKAYALRA